MMRILSHIILIFLMVFQVQAEEKAKTQVPTKPTGAMIPCDRRINRAAIRKVLADLPLKHFGSSFSLKSGVYYPAELSDESFDVGVIAGGQEYDLTVTMDEKCKKVLEVKIDK